MKHFYLLLLLGTSITSFAADIDGHGAHEHGVAHLTLAMEGQSLQIALESPADNVVGFEHAPIKARDKAAVEAALAQLRQPALLKPGSDAGCNKGTAKAENPFTATGNTAHRDFDAEYLFQCQFPGKLTQLDASALFRTFPRLRTLKVDYALPAGQGSGTLTPRAPRIRLVP